jgi:electron transfer flavoprotein beta subunit
MKAKAKKLAQMTPADFAVDLTPRLKTLKVSEPSKRLAGVKVADVDALVDKLKDMGIAQ